MTTVYPGIPTPQPDVQSLTHTTLALKSSMEILTGKTKHAAVSYSNLNEITYSIDSYITQQGALVESLSEIVVSPTGTFATLQTLVSVQGGLIAGNSASIATNSTAIAGIDGVLSARYSVTLDVNHKVTGFSLLADNSGASSFDVVADQFNIWAVGYTNTPVFSVSTVGGVAALTINGNQIGDLSLLNNGLANNAATNGSASTGRAAGSNTSGTASVTARAGARIVIIATYNGGTHVTGSAIFRAGLLDISYVDPSSVTTTKSFVIPNYYAGPTVQTIDNMTCTAVIQIGSVAAGTWSAFAHSYLPTIGDYTDVDTTVTIQEFSK